MASIHEYERWKDQRGANYSSQVSEWLRNEPPVTAPADQTLGWITLAASCLATAAVIYVLIRYRDEARAGMKFVIARGIVAATRIGRHFRYDARDSAHQVRFGLAETTVITSAQEPVVTTRPLANHGRTALALRLFFNVAIAPLLLGIFLVGTIIALKAIGVISE